MCQCYTSYSKKKKKKVLLSFSKYLLLLKGEKNYDVVIFFILMPILATQEFNIFLWRIDRYTSSLNIIFPLFSSLTLYFPKQVNKFKLQKWHIYTLLIHEKIYSIWNTLLKIKISIQNKIFFKHAVYFMRIVLMNARDFKMLYLKSWWNFF